MGSQTKNSFSVSCPGCSAKFNMSERLWKRRVAGRVTTIHCRKCSAPIRLDGTMDETSLGKVRRESGRPGAPTEHSKSDATVHEQSAHKAIPRLEKLPLRPSQPAPLAAKRTPVVVPMATRSDTKSPSEKSNTWPVAIGPREASQKGNVVDPVATPQPVIALEPPRPDRTDSGTRLGASTAPRAPSPDGHVASTPATARATESFAKTPPSNQGPEPPVDAESVPSLRALVVATPGSDAAARPKSDGLRPTIEERISPTPVVEPPPAPPPAQVHERGQVNRSKRVVVLGGLTALAAAATLWVGRAEFESSAGERESAAASEVMAMPLDEPRTPTVEAAAPVELPEAPQRARTDEPTEEPPTRAAYDAQRLGFAMRWARSHALSCHRGGRAGGTVHVEITFAPEGKVSDVVLRGEPVASAPVGRCIESYFKAMLLPPYEGEPFIVHEQLTLR